MNIQMIYSCVLLENSHLEFLFWPVCELGLRVLAIAGGSIIWTWIPFADVQCKKEPFALNDQSLVCLSNLVESAAAPAVSVSMGHSVGRCEHF